MIILIISTAQAAGQGSLLHPPSVNYNQAYRLNRSYLPTIAIISVKNKLGSVM